MMKLFKHIALLFIILVLADRLIGTVLEHYFYKQLHGDDYITLQVLDATKANLLIVGSSRASHHYVSDSLQTYTGLTTFNGGRDNMGIHYTEATIREMLERYQPKYILFDIIPYNFIKGNQNTSKYFEVQSTVLLPFAHKHPGLYNAIGAINQSEVWKSKCINTYAYNSLAGTIFQNAFTHIGHQQQNGYEPLVGNIDTAFYHQQVFAFTTIKNGIDTAAFDVLKNCLQLCNEQGVRPILCFSPFYFKYQHEALLLQTFQQIAANYHTPLLDYASDTSFTQHPELFYDELHLNHTGALLFSKQIATKILSK